MNACVLYSETVCTNGCVKIIRNRVYMKSRERGGIIRVPRTIIFVVIRELEGEIITTTTTTYNRQV